MGLHRGCSSHFICPPTKCFERQFWQTFWTNFFKYPQSNGRGFEPPDMVQLNQKSYCSHCFVHILHLNDQPLVVIQQVFTCLFLLVCFCFLALQMRRMDVPRLGVQSELQLPAYTTGTARRCLSHICNYITAHSNAGSPTH